MQSYRSNPQNTKVERSQTAAILVIVLYVALAVAMIAVFFKCTLPGAAYLFGKRDSEVHPACVGLGIIFIVNIVIGGIISIVKVIKDSNERKQQN